MTCSWWLVWGHNFATDNPNNLIFWLLPPYFLKQLILTNRLKMRFFKMEKCNFLKILQCPDFENLWGDSWHLFQPKKLDESDGGFCFWRIIFSSHVQCQQCQQLYPKTFWDPKAFLRSQTNLKTWNLWTLIPLDLEIAPLAHHLRPIFGLVTSIFNFFLFLLLLSAAVVLRCGVTLFSSQCVTNTGCFLTLSLSIFSLRSAKPKQVFRFLGFFSLSFLFDWPSFIFWKGWNCKDWCWSHWTKHKGNCPIFHFLNKTQNIYLFRFHFLSECFDEYCKKTDRTVVN